MGSPQGMDRGRPPGCQAPGRRSTPRSSSGCNAGRDGDYLLAGNRLAEYERWRASTSMSLTAAEQDYLDASVKRRDEGAATELARTAREAHCTGAPGGVGGVWSPGAVALAAVAVVVFLAGPDKPPSVALVYAGRGDDIGNLVADGLDRAVEDFGVKAKEITPPFTDLDDTLDRLAGTDLVIARQEVAGASTCADRGPSPRLDVGVRRHRRAGRAVGRVRRAARAHSLSVPPRRSRRRRARSGSSAASSSLPSNGPVPASRRARVR